MLLSSSQEPFVDSVDQDQTARNVQSDLNLPCPIRIYLFSFQVFFKMAKVFAGKFHFIYLSEWDLMLFLNYSIIYNC